MICPYLYKLDQVIQNVSEYNDIGQNTFMQSVLAEVKRPGKCLKEECAA